MDTLFIDIKHYDSLLRIGQLTLIHSINKNEEVISITNWITILSVITIIVGWFINSFLARNHEVQKERFKYRMNALMNCLQLLYEIESINNFVSEKKIISTFFLIKTEMNCYAKKEEVDLFNEIFNKVVTEGIDVPTISRQLNSLIELIIISIRYELKL